MSERIEIYCEAGIDLVGCKRPFTLVYDPQDFYGMTEDQIDDMINQDATDHAIESYLSVKVEIPSGLAALPDATTDA